MLHKRTITNLFPKQFSCLLNQISKELMDKILICQSVLTFFGLIV